MWVEPYSIFPCVSTSLRLSCFHGSSKWRLISLGSRKKQPAHPHPPARKPLRIQLPACGYGRGFFPNLAYLPTRLRPFFQLPGHIQTHPFIVFLSWDLEIRPLTPISPKANRTIADLKTAAFLGKKKMNFPAEPHFQPVVICLFFPFSHMSNNTKSWEFS